MAYMRQNVQGLGEYDPLATPWSWMFYPPPYDFADPLGIVPPPTFIAPAEEMGLGHLGDCGCGGSCGGCGGHSHGQGLGQLFASGWDISGWGIGEWSIVAAGAFVVYSVFFTGKTAATSVSRSVRRRASQAKKRAALQAAMDSL